MAFQLTTAFLSLVLISHVMHRTQSTCFTSRANITLKGHVIFSFKTAALDECWRICEEHGRCQSLNFFGLNHRCEINNRTIELASNYSVKTSYTAYFDNPYRVPVGTAKRLPALSCAEILKSVGAVSGRYWLVDHACTNVPFMAYCNMTTLAIEDCAVGQCKNGGTCSYFGLGKYQCACPMLWSGQNCEIKLSVCFSTPCKNGGTCIDQGDNFKCACANLFYGNHCEKECSHSVALGMQSLKISDAQITASSSFGAGYAPSLARLHRRVPGKAGGWSAKQAQTGDWIQVDFYAVKILTQVCTQGRSDAAQWVTRYTLSYSKTGSSFVNYEGGKIFTGNSDQTSVVTRALRPVIIARYIRLHVKGYRSWPSLRMEYLGCDY